MNLPLSHSCDGPGCDPEDEDHRLLRLKKQERLLWRAESKADQAWAEARDAMPTLIKINKKLSGQGTLIPEDIDVLKVAINLVLGELHLRQARY